MFHANGRGKKSGVAIFISDKISVKPKTIRKKESITQSKRVNRTRGYDKLQISMYPTQEIPSI